MKRTYAVCSLLWIIATVAVHAQAEDRFLYQSAEQRFRSGDYAVALERYDQFLREYPASELVPDVQFRRAVTQYQLGRYQESADLLQRVQSRYRSTRFLPYVPYYLGMSLFQLGQYDRAVKSMEDVDLSDPAAQAESQLYLARALIAMDRQDQAVGYLEELLSGSDVPADVRGFAAALYVSILYDQQSYAAIPEAVARAQLDDIPDQWSEQIQLFHAEALFHQGEREQAREMYAGLTDSRLEIASVAFQRLFVILQDDGDSGEVEEIIRQAEQVLAGRSAILKDFWLQVGLGSFRSGQLDRAELYLRRVWDLRGVHAVDEIVPLYLAEIAEERGEPARGIAVLQNYLERNTSDTVLFRLAALQSKIAQWDNARANIAQLRNMYPDSELFSRASYLHAYVLVQQERYQDALGIIRDLYARGLTSGIQQDLLRLEAQTHRQLGNTADAIDSFRDYLALRPLDSAARVEYVTVLFEEARYDAVEREIAEVFTRIDEGDSSEPAVPPQDAAKLNYLRGLAAVSSNDFAAASEYFRDVSRLSRQEAAELGGDVTSVHPYNLFYHAWSRYQNGSYSQALDLFRRIGNDYPDSAVAGRAMYLGGWSAFADGNYTAAADMLRQTPNYPSDEELQAGAAYLLAQVLVEQDNFSEALHTYRLVYEEYPDSPRALDARYGYAETLQRQGEEEAAVRAFGQVSEAYPDTYLGQEALYRRGNILFDRGEYRDAQEALYTYRTRYPEGDRIDDALYMGAQAAEALDETSGALLLWNRLIQEHSESPYRFDAMMRAVELHRERGEYRSALNLVSEANSRYPEQSAAAGGRRIANELVLLVNGVSEREAELRVEIEQNDGVETAAGREAILELGRTVMYESFELADDAERVVALLRELGRRGNQNPDQAAEALQLLGEYNMRIDRPDRAADLFIDAAAAVESDRDLMARSLYRAAEAFVQDGRSAEARELVDRIISNFPQTQWSEAAGRLLED